MSRKQTIDLLARRCSGLLGSAGALAVFGVAGLVAIPGRARADDAAAQARVFVKDLKTRPVKRKGLEHQVYHERPAQFTLGEHSYTIAYKAAYDDTKPGEAFPGEGYIGMPRPTSCNWYHSGFLFIRLNGQELGRTAIAGMTAAENGERAIMDMVWHHALGDVRIRFLGLPGEDHLMCEIAVEPKQELTSLELMTRCYPSFFTAWHKRKGARRVQTPTVVVKQGEKPKLPASEAWWAVYSDDTFDVAKGEGEGPCAMMLLPNEARDVTFLPSNYPVETRIAYPPTCRRIRLAFWDFKGKTNAEALARVQGSAEELRQRLDTLDFTPRAVTSFDFAAARAQLKKALESEAIRELLGPKVADVTAWFEQYGSGLGSSTGPPTIRTEAEVLQSIDKLTAFIWEVRLAELVSDL